MLHNYIYDPTYEGSRWKSDTLLVCSQSDICVGHDDIFVFINTDSSRTDVSYGSIWSRNHSCVTD